jgi:hypothetical protein
VLVLALALSLPSAAFARGGGGDDVRVSGSCGRGASAELRLKSDDGAIEVEFRVRRAPDGERWQVVLVHERRVASRGGVTTGGSGFRIRRDLADYGGADEITARATGPRGLTCQASAVLSGA